MKILVNKLPLTCESCEFCAPAMMMSELGVPKQINVCTLRATLVPPATPEDQPPIVELEKSPKDNKCLCMELGDTEEENNDSSSSVVNERLELEKRAAKSGLILS